MTSHYLLLKPGHGLDLGAIRAIAERESDEDVLAWVIAQQELDLRAAAETNDDD